MTVGVEYLTFFSYVLVGPTSWVLYALGMHTGRRRLSLLEKVPADLPADPPDPPAVTVVVPAKNEAGAIERCLRSVLAQNYPAGRLRVLAINDRSTDDTGAIIDRLAVEDARVRTLHIAHGAVPPGWTGKNHALHTAMTSGLVETLGGWMLFIDSDVTLAPDAVRRTMAYAIASGHEFVSLLLRLDCRTYWERLVIPLCAAGVIGLYGVPYANHNHLHGVAFANGQFMLMTRRAYDAFGGHAAVRDQFSEDVQIARLAKRLGLRPRIAWGIDLASVRMYASLPAVLRGWGRNFYGCSAGNPLYIVAGMAFVTLCGFTAYAALAWAVYRWFTAPWYQAAGWSVAAVVHLAVMTACLARTYRWSGNPARMAAAFPFGGGLLMYIFVIALRHCATGRVAWRGDVYGRSADQRRIASG